MKVETPLDKPNLSSCVPLCSFSILLKSFNIFFLSTRIIWKDFSLDRCFHVPIEVKNNLILSFQTHWWVGLFVSTAVIYDGFYAYLYHLYFLFFRAQSADLWIHRQHHQKCPRYDIKLHPQMRFQCGVTASLPLLSCPLWTGVVVLVRVPTRSVWKINVSHGNT